MSPSRVSLRVHAYVFAVVGLSVVGLLAAIGSYPALIADVRNPIIGLVAFVAIGLALEVAEHRLAFGAATGSIAFIVYLGAALIFGPAACALVAGVSITTAQVINRKPPIKVAFNVAQNVLSLVTGSLVYLSFGGIIPLESVDRALLPFAAFVLSYFIINSSAVSGVVALSEGRRFSDVWLGNTWGLAAYEFVAGFLGLGIGWLYMAIGPLGIAVVVLPLVFLRHTYLVNLQLQAAHRDLLDLMVKAIEARDPYTSGHSQRVSQLARLLAREAGVGFRECDHIAHAALLHDVGKIYEEFAPLLRKEGRLTADERQLMQTHAVRSADLVGTISTLRGPVERYVRHHHENFDGSGYPDGLAGDQIPFGARVIMIADTTDAMITDRPYRKALSFERVISELDSYSGRQFDPSLVQIFKRSRSIQQIVEAWQQRSQPLLSEVRERLPRVAAR